MSTRECVSPCHVQGKGQETEFCGPHLWACLRRELGLCWCPSGHCPLVPAASSHGRQKLAQPASGHRSMSTAVFPALWSLGPASLISAQGLTHQMLCWPVRHLAGHITAQSSRDGAMGTWPFYLGRGRHQGRHTQRIQDGQLTSQVSVLS